MNAWDTLGSLLAVRLDGLGDLLMTTPALRALKHARPHRRLSLLTSNAGAQAADGLSFVDDVLVMDAPWIKHGDPSPASLERTRALLQAGRYEGAVIFTVCTQSALPAAMLCMQAGIGRRLAYSRENPYALLTDWVRDPDADLRAGVRHEVRRQLDLVAVAGADGDDVRLVYVVPAWARESLERRLLDASDAVYAMDRCIVMHPGASAASRRYAPARFADVARQLAARGEALVIAGGADDANAAAMIRNSAPAAIDLCGKLALAELAALLERADVLIANNSGPAHLAAAVGTPVVDLYALTNPQHTPWGVPSRVLNRDTACRNCLSSTCAVPNHPCMDVAPIAVVHAVDQLVRGKPRPSRRAGIVPEQRAAP